MELSDSRVFRAMQRMTMLQYQKILYLDLTDDFYFVLKVQNKQWDVDVEKMEAQKLSDWFSWFVESTLCHDDDRPILRENLSVPQLRKVFSDNNCKPISISYRRKNYVGDEAYYINQLEFIPEVDEFGHQIAFLFIHVEDEEATASREKYTAIREKKEENVFIEHVMSKHRRTVLVVEDNETNCELLHDLLCDEYDVLEAKNGKEGLEILQQEYARISLVLLDVFMPVMDGFEFLSIVKEDSLLNSIPIIVTTSSNNQDDEARCLQLGATDYVTKPYVPSIVKMRIAANIKLHESSAAISAVEYDGITGLYTKAVFFQNFNRMLSSNPEGKYNVMVSVVDNYRSISEQYGPIISKRVLNYVGKRVSQLMRKRNFYATQIRDNMFVSLVEVSNAIGNPQEDIDNFTKDILNDAPVQNISIKMSLYENVDTEQSAEILVERAVAALETIRHKYGQDMVLYDQNMIGKQAREEAMENEFDEAIRTGQFEVWYQPKYSTITEEIIGAEALIRWRGKDGKLISPGEFIPVFEKNGQIHILDEYVFRKVCDFQKKQKMIAQKVIPISVNLSRASMYHSDIVHSYDVILREYGLMPSMIPIEITETAAIHSSSVRELAENLIGEGFNLHMDDFGSGYSSLASLQILDFETIKIDKSLVDFIGTPGGESLLRHTIAYAKEAGMRVVAEGVENELQLKFLKNTQCDAVQGFYFSKPIPENEFRQKLQAGDTK